MITQELFNTPGRSSFARSMGEYEQCISDDRERSQLLRAAAARIVEVLKHLHSGGAVRIVDHNGRFCELYDPTVQDMREDARLKQPYAMPDACPQWRYHTAYRTTSGRNNKVDHLAGWGWNTTLKTLVYMLAEDSFPHSRHERGHVVVTLL